MDPKITLFILQMIVQGIISFLAIFVMSKTRAPSWMFMVAGFLFSYAILILNLMETLEVISLSTLSVTVLGMNLFDFISVVVPGFCFITGLILKLIHK